MDPRPAGPFHLWLYEAGESLRGIMREGAIGWQEQNAGMGSAKRRTLAGTIPGTQRIERFPGLP
jgi:hypothetical protein